MLYFIEDGVPVPAAGKPDNGYALSISPDAVRVLWRDEDPTLYSSQTPPVLHGNVITAGPDFTGTIIAPGLMTVDTYVYTLVLRQGKPWDSPFAGDWQVLLTADESGLHQPENPRQGVIYRFTPDAMTELLPDGVSVVHAVQYDGNVCLISDGDAVTLTAAVDRNRLMTLSRSDAPDLAILLVPVPLQ